jgi:hypothetical protein
VKEGDVWSSDVKKLTATDLGWNQGEVRSYRQVQLEGMAERGGRGCGRGRGGCMDEDQWAHDPARWNPGFPSFPPPQFPHPYGFFPNLPHFL